LRERKYRRDQCAHLTTRNVPGEDKGWGDDSCSTLKERLEHLIDKRGDEGGDKGLEKNSAPAGGCKTRGDKEGGLKCQKLNVKIDIGGWFDGGGDQKIEPLSPCRETELLEGTGIPTKEQKRDARGYMKVTNGPSHDLDLTGVLDRGGRRPAKRRRFSN